MSASAPLGRPSRNTGSVDAVCTSATQIGVAVSDVIIQAAATSFIHMLMLAISQVIHSMRKTGSLNGASGDRSAPCAGARRGESGWGSGMAGGVRLGSGSACARPGGPS
jgi:hypothetical protein